MRTAFLDWISAPDDYIVKPFSPGEVMARIRAVLRRIPAAEEKETLVVGELSIHLPSLSVALSGHKLNLTRREVELLYTLASAPGRVFMRDNLLTMVWGYEFLGNYRAVDSHIKRLRAKLDVYPHESFAIATVWGAGYKFERKLPEAPVHRTLAARLTGLFALLLILFTLLLGLIFNAMMERKMVAHYSRTMQRDAYAHFAESFGNDRAVGLRNAGRESVYRRRGYAWRRIWALIEHITNCNVYLIDEQHHVTGYFDGVVQTMSGKLLPGYIEQTIALGFMGKTPFLSAKIDGETHLTTGMPIMNARSHVLGVVLLESTLRELGFAQVSSSDILLVSGALAFVLTVLLGALFSRMFTQPITACSALRASWRAANTKRG